MKNEKEKNVEMEIKVLDKTIFILVGISIVFVLFFILSMTLNGKQMEEKQVGRDNDLSGWAENYIHLYDVTFVEKEEESETKKIKGDLFFIIDNRSPVSFENIERVTLFLKQDGNIVDEKIFKNPFALDGYGEKAFKQEYLLTKGETYNVQAIVTYGDETYELEETAFYVNDVQ